MAPLAPPWLRLCQELLTQDIRPKCGSVIFLLFADSLPPCCRVLRLPFDKVTFASDLCSSKYSLICLA